MWSILPKDISENVSNLEEIEKAIKKIINNEKIDVKNKLLSKHIKNSQANNYSHYIKISFKPKQVARC